MHPRDGRPVFALPWEGAIVYGTTDVDQGEVLVRDPSISSEEADYLLEGIRNIFPSLDLSFKDVLSTYSGIRPVIDTGKANPSKESREHVLWDENGLLTVGGGKLTTFRIMAREALKAVRRHIGYIHFDPETPILDPIPQELDAACSSSKFTAQQCLRLLSRYGQDARMLFTASDEELQTIGGTIYSWAELRLAARNEAIVHLEDLLLRRIRIELLAQQGGQNELDRIRPIVQKELGWNDSRWVTEETNYIHLWKDSYRYSE